MHFALEINIEKLEYYIYGINNYNIWCIKLLICNIALSDITLGEINFEVK